MYGFSIIDKCEFSTRLRRLRRVCVYRQLYYQKARDRKNFGKKGTGIVIGFLPVDRLETVYIHIQCNIINVHFRVGSSLWDGKQTVFFSIRSPLQGCPSFITDRIRRSARSENLFNFEIVFEGFSSFPNYSSVHRY